MKKLLIYLFLILFYPSISFANSISEYEVGGLRLGKSLLDVITEDEIKENMIPTTSGADKFVTTLYIANIFTYPDLDFGLYAVTFKVNDKKYKIYGFYAIELFENDFKGCLKKQDQLTKELAKKFGIKPYDWGIDEKPSTRKGKWRAVIFDFPIPSDTASVLCYHFEDEPERDNLKLGILTREYADFITVK